MPGDRKIMEFTSKRKDNSSLKWSRSTLSPGESDPSAKKANLVMEGKVQEHTSAAQLEPAVGHHQTSETQGSNGLSEL